MTANCYYENDKCSQLLLVLYDLALFSGIGHGHQTKALYYVKCYAYKSQYYFVKKIQFGFTDYSLTFAQAYYIPIYYQNVTGQLFVNQSIGL